MEHQSISPTLPVPIALAVEAAASTKKKKTEARPVPQHGKATNFMPGYVSKTTCQCRSSFFSRILFYTCLHRFSVAALAHTCSHGL